MTTTTNLGPLTTVFTPPPDCSTPYLWSVSNGEGFYGGEWGFTCESSRNGVIAQTCYPPELGSYIFSVGNDATLPIYSPGLSCPDGFTSACTLTRQAGDSPPPTGPSGGTADIELWSQLSVGETAIGCCPSGYSCYEWQNPPCESTLTPGQVVSGVTYENACKRIPNTVTIPINEPDGGVGAFRIQLVISGLKTSSRSTASTGASATATASATSSDGSRGSSSASSGGGDLSNTAKAVIGILVSLLGIGGIAFFIFLFLRRRLKSKRGDQQAARGRDAYEKPELDADKSVTVTAAPRSELDPAAATPRHELEAVTAAVYELPDVRPAQEPAAGSDRGSR